MDSSSPVPLDADSYRISIFLLDVFQHQFYVLINFLLIFLFLALNGIITSAETALFSLSHYERKEIEKKLFNSDIVLLQLLEHPISLLATVLVSNLLIYSVIVAIGFKLYYQLTGYFHDLDNRAIIAFLIVSIVCLKMIFGEIIPKIYAVQNNLSVARKTAYPLKWLNHLLKPFTYLFILSSSFLRNKFEIYNKRILVDEIDQALGQEEDNSEERGKEERNLLRGVVKFGNIYVTQIMKSRVDVVSADISLNFSELLETVRKSGYSRIPVCNGDLDQTVGILYAKDLLYYLDADETFNWHTFIKPALFVPESKKIDDLLEEFQLKRVHMAIVVDEYGGASGLVTMEDILEEVIGEIKDEFDDIHEIDYRKIDENNFVFEGKTSVNDMCKMIHIPTDTFDDKKGEADTIAGMLLEIKGELPEKGEEFEINGFTFRVVEMNATRIVKVKITTDEI